MEEQGKSPSTERAASKPVDTTTDGLIHNDLTQGSDRYPDVFFEFVPDRIVRTEQKEGGYFFYCQNQITLQVVVLAADLFRLRYSLHGEFQRDFSYAINPEFRAEAIAPVWEEDAHYFYLRTDQLECRISRVGMRVNFYDRTGQLISAETEGFKGLSTILKGITKLEVAKLAHPEESYYGLGDKSCSSNLRGNKLENWNTDAFGYSDTTDPLYRSVPFYYGLYRDQGYGIFMDNSYRSHFDFDSQEDGQIRFSAVGGEMDYYFLYGPRLLRVAERYTDLTGRPQLPPLWALGFHQCRWSYYPEARVREVCDEFRRRQIPCAAIYLDIDYMDEYRCFTWSKEHFPQPQQLIADLKAQGFQTVVMIDPGIKVDPEYFVYQQGRERDLFCRRPNGELMTGPVWPPDCVFPDYTLPRVREWWGLLYRELYLDQGISGFWNDMNEPAVFKINFKTFPEDVRHDYDGQPCSHAKAHNIYGLQMSRATYEGLAKLQPDKRPFVLTRATFSGGHRYAAAWTGDNVASWEHLVLANIQCQRMSLSGFSFVGTDIGGFVEQPTGELLVRWLQLGIFHPVFRVHSMGNNTDGATQVDETSVKKSEAELRMDQEPWSFGEDYTALAKEAIELRYRLLPYHYTTFWQYAQKGTPMLRSLAFEAQADAEARSREAEFVFGDHLLVAPVTSAACTQQEMYLPPGKWYHYFTEEVQAGPQLVEVATPLEYSPIFVRAGAVLPHYPVMQYTGESPVDILELHVYYDEGVVDSYLYEDEGEGFAHREGAYALRHFQTQATAEGFRLAINKTGARADSYQQYQIWVHGLPFKPQKCLCRDASLEIQRDEAYTVPVYSVIVSIEFDELHLISG